MKYNSKKHLDLPMSYEEVGNELGITPHACCCLESRALKKVSRKLKEKFGERITLDDILPIARIMLEVY